MRHRFHALCPYFAMFPESFVERWVRRLTKPGDAVLDPFCGRGTTPFQSLLMGRVPVATDVNPVAYVVSRAKTRAPAASSLRARLTRLEREFDADQYDAPAKQLPAFFRYAYKRPTLRQILFLRDRLDFRGSDTDCMLAALVLGSLHGESERSPSFLSNQMPHTISTKPDYSVRFWRERGLRAPSRDVFQFLRGRIDYRYASPRPPSAGSVWQTDMRELPRVAHGLELPIRCVITSPPYFDVTSFEEDQWLRLWFLGGPPHPTRNAISVDDRHEEISKYWSMIGDLWRSLGQVVAKRAHVVVRIGSTRITPRGLVEGLEGSSVLSGRRIRLVSSRQSEIERRQTDSFRPGSSGCQVEVDCHFLVN